jgi:PTS system nitrogen regulatory IIA component
MKLLVKDAARLLEVSEKTIYRWIKQGSIPAYRLNEQYRFNRAELLEWATAQRVPLSVEIFQEPEGEPLPRLSEALATGGIHYRVAGATREAALRQVVSLMNLPEEVDREFLYQMVLARETLGSTGVGDGIAIPHVRNPIVLHLSRATVTLCFLERPVDFGALDGQPVSTLFTLISPTVRAHLHLLSRLAFTLRDPRFHAALRTQASREEILDALHAAETALAAARPELQPHPGD